MFKYARRSPNQRISGQFNETNPASTPKKPFSEIHQVLNTHLAPQGTPSFLQTPSSTRVASFGTIPAPFTGRSMQRDIHLQGGSYSAGNFNAPEITMPPMSLSFPDNQTGIVAAGNVATIAPSSNSTPVQGFEDSKKANYAVQSIKDSNFSEDIKQGVKETKTKYDICSCQYGLSDRQKSDLFIHAFEDTACRYFMENSTPGISFPLMCEVMEKEYISDARK